MKNIGLIIIGDEILSGKIDDLNLKWFSKYVLKENINLLECRFIRDTKEDICQAIDECLRNCDAIITTGGLGPTVDDVTKKVLSDYFDSPIEENLEVASFVESQYQKIGKSWDRSKNGYHLFPLKADFIKNPQGLAPGFLFKKEEKMVFSCPGVPREFQAMVDEEIMPIIREKFNLLSFASEYFHIRTYGMPEEDIFNDKHPDLWQRLSQFGKVSSLPTVTGVDISMTLLKDDQIAQKKKAIKDIIESIDLKNHVWHYGAESINELIVKKASEKNITIGFCESCTGGLTSSKITDIAGSSSVFMGSVIAYSNEIKENILGVNKQTLKNFGAVSEQTALEMAQGGKEKLGVDICISFTGIAGPGGGSIEKPVGTLGLGISSKFDTTSKIYNFRGNRLKLKERFCMIGLIKLLKEIEKY